MSCPPVIDFLTKEIMINKNVVTFRLLSRQLSMHVNAAKNELASFHEQARNSSQPVYATYVVSGDVSDGSTSNLDPSQDDSMDVDYSEEIDEYEEEVQRIKLVLVGERDLEAVKFKFQNIHSCHIYCLSLSALRDAGFICAPSEHVIKADSAKGADFAQVVGKVVSSHVKLSAKAGKGKGKVTKGPTSLKPMAAAAPARSPTVPLLKLKAEEKEKAPSPPPPVPVKAKESGMLDWSKAKSKETKKEAPSAKQVDRKVKQEKGEAGPSAKGKAALKDKEDQKRGTKRKSNVMALSDTEGEASKPPSPAPNRVPTNSSKPPSTKGARVKKGVVMSDDEDDEDGRPQRTRGSTKGKAKAREDNSDVENSLRAMMDVDDDNVTRVSRPNDKNRREEEEEEEEEEENEVAGEKAKDVATDDDSDLASKPKPRKRKEKKIIPVGRNGLKKRRTVKSRMKTDEKGYMVTEDYSSYESAEEEEQEEEEREAKAPKVKQQKKAPQKKVVAKKAVKVAPDDSDSSSKPKAAVEEAKQPIEKKPLKPTGSGSGAAKASGGVKSRPGQNNLMSYFGGGGSRPKK